MENGQRGRVSHCTRDNGRRRHATNSRRFCQSYRIDQRCSTGRQVLCRLPCFTSTPIFLAVSGLDSQITPVPVEKSMTRSDIRLTGANYLLEHFRVTNEDPRFAGHGQSVFENSKFVRWIGTPEKTRDSFAEFGQRLSQAQLAQAASNVSPTDKDIRKDVASVPVIVNCDCGQKAPAAFRRGTNLRQVLQCHIEKKQFGRASAAKERLDLLVARIERYLVKKAGL